MLTKWRSVIPRSVLLVCVLAATVWAQPSGTGTATRVANAVIAASCSQSDVTSAISAATSGDTVLIPAGTCTWSTNVQVAKSIHLRGSGIGTTTIPAASHDLTVIQVLADDVEVSHLTLTGGARVLVSAGNDWRIHDMAFAGTSAFTGVFVRGNSATSIPRGVVDSSTFSNARVLVHGYPASNASEHDGTTHWSRPLGLGTEEAVYVEDNQFTFSEFYNVFDCEYSGRIVFRHNTVTDSYLETHSIQGHARACRKWEVYGNTIQQVSREVYRPIFFRGGTGVIFDNVVTGTFGVSTVHFDNVRTFTNVGGEVGQCDGTSNWDGNVESNGYPCRDQIGRGVDASAWPLTAPYPAQSLDPAYIWNNTINGSALGVTVINGSEVNHIKPNRDYYVNVGAKPDYTPYTYPHPLRTP